LPPGPGKSEAVLTYLQGRGVTFTPGQGACLGPAFADRPDLLEGFDPGRNPDVRGFEGIFGILDRCMGGHAAAVHVIVQTVEHDGGWTPAQSSCFEKFFARIPPADLNRVLAGDPEMAWRYPWDFVGCQWPQA
jgi:hypothetical protein